MVESSSIASAAAVHDFLLRYLADREAGREVSLEHYLELFPGHQAEIARKHEELCVEAIRASEGHESLPHVSVSPPRGHDREDFTTELVKRLSARRDAYRRYEIEGEVARGGQGVVMRVRDEDLRRDLAMKVLRRDLAARSPETAHTDSRALGRFLEEAQVTGQLDHPGVVPIHELGVDSEGHVYFTMKLVKGRDLKTVFRLVREQREGWNLTRALNVLLRVCEAMAYAHSKGVIHRDLKPSNVMVGKYGEVYVMDWGVARVSNNEDSRDIRVRPESPTGEVRTSRREVEEADSPLLTMDGDVVGTPAYMSPEQAAGELDAMGPPSDVYAAGAMLYHLLAGQMPYVSPGSRPNSRATWLEVQKGPPAPLREVAPGAPAELASICEKAMSRKTGSRYADMSELAEDLRAYLEHRVVGAHRTGVLAELGKWIERNKVLAATVAGATVALVLGAVLYVSGIATAEEETTRALVSTRATGLASAAEQNIEHDSMLALLLAREAVRVERTPETLSRLHQAVGAVRERAVFRSARFGFHDAVFSPSGDALLGITFGMGMIWDREGNETRLEGHSARMLTSGVFSPSGRYALTAALDNTARLWDMDGRLLATYPHDGWVWSAAFSPDERHVATASQDGTARVWRRDGNGGPTAILRGHEGPVLSARFSPAGDHLLTTSQDATGRLWRVHDDGTVQQVADLVGHESAITAAGFSPGGDRIVTASGFSTRGRGFLPDSTARIWDLSGRQLAILEGHTEGVESAVFSPGSDRILTASFDRTGRLWDLDGKTVHVYRPPSNTGALWGSISPDGRLVVLSGWDPTTWLFDLTGGVIGPLSGHKDEVLSARFSPDSRSIVTASTDGTVRLWSVVDDTVPALYGHTSSVLDGTYSPDGTRIATASSDATARVWDTSGRELAVLEGHRLGLNSVHFDRAGQRLLTSSWDGTARIWDLEGEELHLLEHGPTDGELQYATFSPDGARVATAFRTGWVYLWNANGTRLSRFKVDGWVNCVEFDPSGEDLVLTVRVREGVRLYTSGGQLVHSFDTTALRATFSPRGDQILVASGAGKMHLLNRALEPLREFGAGEAAISEASFSPSGDRIVTASMDGTARIWRTDGTLQATLRGHSGPMHSAEFSPSGDRVLTASSDGTARTWLADADELIRVADGRVSRDFTADELVRYEDLLAVRATDARELVDRLSEELILKHHVVAGLRKDPGLDDELRLLSLRMAEGLVDPFFDDLLVEAWAVVSEPEQTGLAYARGLRDIEAAIELQPDHPYTRSLRAAALYRVGRYEEARQQLAAADRENAALPEPRYNRAFDLLFLAMAEERLGASARAADALERAQEQVIAWRATDWPAYQPLSSLASEAAQVIGY